MEIATKITHRKRLTPRYATLTPIYTQKDQFIDEAIVIYFKAPFSFTGEDIVEFQCHGGLVVADIILDACKAHGARLANSGEFTKRAVINGKMDLSKAEAVAGLIESKSVDAALILSKQLKGDLQEFVDTLRDSLVEVLAFVEVNIDYAEEDLPQNLQDQILEKLLENQKILQKTVDASESRQGLLNGFRVSIIGKPNVGKSSLLNSLLSYNRAIISDIAGTTRDTIEESIKIGTHLIKIVDTAGIRDANDEIERIGIERSIEAIEESEIVIALFDGSDYFSEDDEKILELLNEYRDQKEILVAINKTDLVQNIQKNRLDNFNPILISCKGETKVITDRLKAFLDTQSLEDEMMLISKRQIDATRGALEAIKEARGVLISGELELFAYNINESIEFISSITKSFERDEILDKMFSNFCLGK